MPYEIRRSGSQWVVVTQDTGKVHGTHPTRADAIKQLRAMYVHANPKKERR